MLQGLAVHSLPDEHPALRVSALALVNARASEQLVTVFPQLSQHWDADVRQFSMAMLDHLPLDVRDDALLELLHRPHDGAAADGGVADGVVMRAALASARRRKPSARVLEHLVGHAAALDELHGVSDAGCNQTCPDRCMAEYSRFPALHWTLSHHCDVWCQRACQHVSRYEHMLLDTLQHHHRHLVRRVASLRCLSLQAFARSPCSLFAAAQTPANVSTVAVASMNRQRRLKSTVRLEFNASPTDIRLFVGQLFEDNRLYSAAHVVGFSSNLHIENSISARCVLRRGAPARVPLV
jgi:hypothetical protein